MYLGIRLRIFVVGVFFYVLLIKYTKNSIINSVILIDENFDRNEFRSKKKKRVPPISFVLDTTKYISMELQGRVPCKNYIRTMRYTIFEQREKKSVDSYFLILLSSQKRMEYLLLIG